MRATTLLNRVLELPGARVTAIDPSSLTGAGPVVLDVALRRRRLACPGCSFTTGHRYDRRHVDSVWRHLDLAGRICRLRMRRRRLACPSHGVVTEAVEFARPGARFTRDFEDLVVWLTSRSDKTTVATFARVAWRTVGAMCERVAADVLDPNRLEGLVDIGVDEISWRKHHRYLTLVTDHDSGTVVWGAPGKNAATLDRFFDELGQDRSDQIEAVSMDLGLAFQKAVTQRAPQATICFDPFHVIKIGTDALETFRRRVWQAARGCPDARIAKKYKGIRWALLKNPDTLTGPQRATIAQLRRGGDALWRAYQLKESLRAILAGDLTADDVADLIARWCSKASRSRIDEFVKASRTIRAHADGIIAAVVNGLSNGRSEGLNNKVRTMINRAYGFHTAEAALALTMLTCGPVNLQLPYHT